MEVEQIIVITDNIYLEMTAYDLIIIIEMGLQNNRKHRRYLIHLHFA